MSPETKATSFRFSSELLARLDAYAEQISTAAGVPVSRGAAATKLLTEALDNLKVDRRPRSTPRAVRR